MPLITCADCGKAFSDSAAACPNCGRPHRIVPMQAEPRKTGCLAWGCLGVIVLGVISSLIPSSMKGPVASTTPEKPFVSIRAAENQVKGLLEDPESARFSNVYTKTKGDVSAVCGLVSAKNGFGGYGEPEVFVVVGSLPMISTSSNSSSFSKVWDAACTDKPLPKPRRKKVGVIPVAGTSAMRIDT